MSASSSSSGVTGVGRTPATKILKPFVHLRTGQSNPPVFLHGFEHVVDQPLDARRRNLVLRNRLGPGSEHGVSHAGHFQNCHG